VTLKLVFLMRERSLDRVGIQFPNGFELLNLKPLLFAGREGRARCLHQTLETVTALEALGIEVLGKDTLEDLILKLESGSGTTQHSQ
jgi:hypothetical protein